MKLVVSHNLFLTKEQRYKWHDGEDLEVVGVSVPVWVDGQDTSEPSSEIFTKYQLKSEGGKPSLKAKRKYYEINVPKVAVCEKPKIPEFLLSLLPKREQDKLQGLTSGLSLQNLLDLKDGGSEWLAFKTNTKITKNKKKINATHFIEIKDMSGLLDSLA